MRLRCNGVYGHVQLRRIGSCGESAELHVNSAIYVQHMTSNKACFIADQKFHSVSDVVRSSHSLQQCLIEHLLLQLGRQRMCHVCLDKSQRHSVHRDVSATHFLCQRFG